MECSKDAKMLLKKVREFTACEVMVRVRFCVIGIFLRADHQRSHCQHTHSINIVESRGEQGRETDALPALLSSCQLFHNKKLYLDYIYRSYFFKATLNLTLSGATFGRLVANVR